MKIFLKMKSILFLIIPLFVFSAYCSERGYSIYKISKNLYLKAPDHEAVYVFNYPVADEIFFQTVRHEMRKPENSYKEGMNYYSSLIYSRVSTDNGKSWNIFDKYLEDPFNFIGEHNYGKSYLYDKTNKILIASWIQFTYNPEFLHKETYSDAGTYTHTMRVFYQLSFNNGKTWSDPKQLIAFGNQYNRINWGPGLSYGKTGASADISRGLEHNGIVYLPLTANLNDGNRYQTAVVQGIWDSTRKDYQWHFGKYITLTLKQSTQGACESQLLLLDNGSFFILMRAAGDNENHTFPTYKYIAYSNDNCKSFSTPQILVYEDSRPLWSPSSYCAIIRSSINKRYYLITNILDNPTYSSYPRDPLSLAEIIPEKGIILKNTVRIIDTNKEPEVERRRYTNFGMYEDKFTREIVLTLPEQPKFSWADMTADCYEYRIKIE
jgi:hypothetical protein